MGKKKTLLDAANRRLTQTQVKEWRFKVKGWNMIFQANGNQKTAGTAILLSDKTDFKPKRVTRGKEDHYIMIKGSKHQEDVTINHKYMCSKCPSTEIY